MDIKYLINTPGAIPGSGKRENKSACVIYHLRIKL
jgi:hypothetical protein